MGEKKNIDRLFQENFKDFEATPSDAVWQNIEAKLKKDKRRVIPIWWKYAGAAVLLLGVLTVGNYILNPEKNSTIQVVETNNTIIENASEKLNTTINNINNTASTLPHSNNDEAINTTLKDSVTKLNTKKSSEASVIAKNSKNNLTTKDNIISTKNKSDSSKSNHTITTTFKTTIVRENLSKNLNNSSKPSVLTKNLENNRNITAYSNQNNSATNAVKENPPKNLNTTTAVTYSTKQEKTSQTQSKSLLIDQEATKTLISEVSNKHTTIAEANTENSNTLSIEEAMAKNENLAKTKSKKQDKWAVTPNVAPVYFNTLNEGSSIDGQFNSNSKSGDINMSYGIGASYAVSKKIKIRSGVNKVNLGYNTNNVIAYQSNTPNNIARSSTGKTSNISVISAKTNKEIPSALAESNTSIHQTFNYIEVPLEMQYAVLEKKFGINLIGGFSSFFLNDNNLYTETKNGGTTHLGEANNINKTSYSANLGIGLNYNFSKTIDLSLEPTFKYQMNTFNNTYGQFSPYIIGIYTGLAVKF